METNQVLTKVGQSANISVINPNVKVDSKPTTPQSEVKPTDKNDVAPKKDAKIEKNLSEKEIKPTGKKKDAPKKDAKTEKTAPKKESKKTTPKTSPVKAFTLSDALKVIRKANKAGKSMSNMVKLIRTFWNGEDGYKAAFTELLGMSYDDITLPNISKLWAKGLIDEKTGVFLFRAKEAITTVDEKTKETVFVLDKLTGKKTYRGIKKELNANFTVERIFQALYEGKIEREEEAEKVAKAALKNQNSSKKAA